MENGNKNPTRQTTQEMDKYCLGIYSIFIIIISGVTIVYIGNNSNVWGMNSNLPSGYDCI